MNVFLRHRRRIQLPLTQTKTQVAQPGEGTIEILGHRNFVLELDVYPIVPGGIFEGTESIITNTDARWRVISEVTLGGSFEYFDGGAWRYTRGPQIGTASFTYTVFNYDGQGNDTTATHSITVN